MYTTDVDAMETRSKGLLNIAAPKGPSTKPGASMIPEMLLSIGLMRVMGGGEGQLTELEVDPRSVKSGIGREGGGGARRDALAAVMPYDVQD